jgi:WD40 repeat protein
MLARHLRCWTRLPDFFLSACVLLPLASFLLLAPRALKRAQATPPPKPIEVKVPSRKEPVSYTKEIAEILENKCVDCHGAILAEHRLNLESTTGMRKGGKHGPALVPGKADDSLMFKLAAHRMEPIMPPRDKPANKPLTPEELGLLKSWIDAGAQDDSSAGGAPTNEQHRPIVLGDLPPGVQPINAVDLTADGARVAAGRANVVQVFDVDSGLEIIALGGHQDLIQSLRFSPDGTLLAAGSYQKITIWNAPTGRPWKSLAGHGGPVGAVAVAHQRDVCYSGSQDKTIRVWNLADGKLRKTWNQPAPVTAVAIGPDDKTIVSGGSDGLVRWLDGTDGRELLALKGHTAAVSSVFLLDGAGTDTRIVSVSEDSTGRIWSLRPAAVGKGNTNISSKASETKPIVLAGHKGPIRCLAITPDAATIITGGDDATIRLWSAQDGKPRGVLPTGHGKPILAVAVDPKGQTILAGSADATARLLVLADGKLLRTFAGHPGPIRSVAFAPSGDRVATADALGGLKVWETSTGLGLIAFGHAAPNGAAAQPIQRIAFHTDESLVSASADATLRVWSFTGTWTLNRTLGNHVSRILALDFNSDGTLLAAGGGEPSRTGELKIWHVGKGLLARSLPSLHSDTVFSVRFSPDGSKLASASADKFVKVTSVADGKVLRSFEGHTHHVMAVDWKSNGGELVSGGADNVLKIWGFDSGEQIRTLEAAGKQVTSVRWLTGKPDVIGASGDAQVRDWNPDSGGIARVYSGAGDYVQSVSASSDGSRIAAGGADGVLFVWNGQNGQVIRKLEPPARSPTH